MTFPAGLASLSSADPLAALRAYRPLAPWSLRDLAALAGALLEASNIVPVNAAARALPGERTIRFYVARGFEPGEQIIEDIAGEPIRERRWWLRADREAGRG